MDTLLDDVANPMPRVRKGTYALILAQCAHCQINRACVLNAQVVGFRKELSCVLVEQQMLQHIAAWNCTQEQ